MNLEAKITAQLKELVCVAVVDSAYDTIRYDTMALLVNFWLHQTYHKTKFSRSKINGMDVSRLSRKKQANNLAGTARALNATAVILNISQKILPCCQLFNCNAKLARLACRAIVTSKMST